ncbi:telomeric repeat binding factor a isoform X2 [Kryptolebias marmoratus]|uniref:telomeric repeat binding factor a isoform X2 n=1 Tax=Kryptolebias marmoratus TaxID=37003 RepID=UPI0007F89137|nr:telomeric repeat binding factor a isoform X2 [Kryptolebias marmoratus]
MAEKESVNDGLFDVESIVNRWVFDYYLSLALEFFKNEQYADFSAISNVVDGICNRPVEVINNDDYHLKISLLQFLSHISNAEKLDQPSERGQRKTPLESALLLLEMMTRDFSLPQRECENVSTSLKEMIVGTFIKNGQFEKAKEALNQYFPRSVTAKKTTFMNLIRQKNKKHKIIEQMNFQSFKEEMLDFCQCLCSFTVPFLYKAAKNLVTKRLLGPDDETSEINEQNQPRSPCCLQINTVQLNFSKSSVIPRFRLEMAYNALAEGSGRKTFAQLMQEVETEAQEKEVRLQHSVDPVRGANLNSEQDLLFQRDSCSPMEASPADQPPQSDTGPQTQADSLSHYTLVRLVTEPDSQPSSQCTTAAEELETEVVTKQSPQTVSSRNDLKDTSCPLTEKEVITPTRKYPRRSTGASSLAKCSADNDEDSLDSVGNKKINDPDLHDRSNRSFIRKSNDFSSASEDKPQEELTPLTPVQRPPEPLSASPLSKKAPGDIEDYCISDSSLDSSSTVSSRPHVPQSSTPHKVTRSPLPKWKEMVQNAKETKDTWSDDESSFISRRNPRLTESTVSNSGSRRRRWTESETQKLKEGVKRFGEGNWNKIKSYYSFSDRSNVNLKDRWRTIKRVNLV